MNIFHSATKMVMDTGEAIGNTTSAAGKTVMETAIRMSGVIANTAFQAGDVVVRTAVASGVAVRNTAIEATQTVVVEGATR